MSGPSSTAFQLRRVTALVGPYGSGKTEIAIGLALWAIDQIRAPGSSITRVALGDMDVLKPYFRSREVNDSLRQAGVGLIAPAGALANSDLPILTPELRGAVSRTDTQLILDVGGDPVGARALGSISDVVSAASYDLLLVLNRYRPFMDEPAKVVAQARSIAAAAQLEFTGVISNTNLLEETTLQDVEWGLELSREVCRELSVPLRLLAAPEEIASQLSWPGLPPVVAIRRRMKPYFMGGVVLAPPSNQPTRGANP
jgi:hypothetical protein